MSTFLFNVLPTVTYFAFNFKNKGMTCVLNKHTSELCPTVSAARLLYHKPKLFSTDSESEKDLCTYIDN